MTQDIFAENFSADPWWWRDAPPENHVSEEPPSEVDVAVVGSGYAGLNCALEVARAGLSVVVLDAGRIGSGASTRNAGFLTGRGGIGKQVDLRAAIGGEAADAIQNETQEAYEFLQDRLATDDIDANFRHCGRFIGAHTPAAFEKQTARIAEHNRGGHTVFVSVPRDRQGAYIKTDAYHGGMAIPDAGSIHPARYHRGLVRLCRQVGVRFASECRVSGIVKDPDGRFTLHTAKGTVRARQAALGTNGYTDKASPWLRRRLIPMSSTIVATENLGEDLVRTLLPALAPVIDAKRVICFSRPTPDNKAILFGGRVKFAPVGPEESARLLHTAMARTFPELSETKLVNAWAGYMAFTFDWLPKLGTRDGVHYAIGCNGGTGVVLMSWLGRHMGQKIAGTTNRISAFETLPFQTRPLYNGNPWFVPFVGTWYRFRDWMDLRQAGLNN